MAVVVIPAYKPDEELMKITDRLWAYGCRMIVVDDGSGEAYRAVFDKIKDVCVILHHPENRGKGAAIKTALSYLKNGAPQEEKQSGDVIGVMDADGQHLPEDMMRLLNFAETHRKALVLGVRTVGREMPLKSRLGNQITRMVFRLVSGVAVSDTQTGLRAFGPELITKLLSVSGERYEYETNVLMACAKGRVPIEELPIDTIYRDRSNSSSHFHSIRDSVRIYRDMLKFTLSSFSGFVLDYLLFSLFLLFLPHTAFCVLLANIAARAVSAFCNYSMNCCFVFHTNRRMQTAARYFALAGVILLLNNLILGMLVYGLRWNFYCRGQRSRRTGLTGPMSRVSVSGYLNVEESE